MQNAKILPLIGLGMVLMALGANHAFHRYALAKPKLLPVEAFPRMIGDWKGGADRPVDPMVNRIAPGAKVLDRLYKRPDGATIGLVLVTGGVADDIHDPQICFPAQGWTIQERKTLNLAGKPLLFLRAQKEDSPVDVLYWFTGKTLREETLPDKLHALRSSLIGIEGNSLLVRLTAYHDDKSERALSDFALALRPALAPYEVLALQDP